MYLLPHQQTLHVFKFGSAWYSASVKVDCYAEAWGAVQKKGAMCKCLMAKDLREDENM